MAHIEHSSIDTLFLFSITPLASGLDTLGSSAQLTDTDQPIPGPFNFVNHVDVVFLDHLRHDIPNDVVWAKWVGEKRPSPCSRYAPL